MFSGPKEILIVILVISLSIKAVKLVDIIFWSVGNFLKGRGFSDFLWLEWINKNLPKMAVFIEKKKAHWIYRLLDLIF